MSNQIVVPELGESITEATVSKWLKQVGETVNSDEPLVELETDKVNVEVPSPLSGVLTSIEVKEGDTVEVGALLGEVKQEEYDLNKDNKKNIETYEEISTQIKNKDIYKKQKKKSISKTLVLDTLAEQESAPIEKELTPFEESNPTEQETHLDEQETHLDEQETHLDEQETHLDEQEINKNEKKKYVPPAKNNDVLSPAVRKIVEENNIDLSKIEGSGKSGRISKGDLINLMGDTPEPLKRKNTHGPEERVKMTRLRSTIAKRLKEAQNNAAMLTTFNEVDMHNIMQMRKDYQEDFTKKYSVRLGFMSFFVKAVVVGLKNFPGMNAEIENDHIIYKNYYNLSIAIGTDRGLVVPVLKNAHELSFADIERNIFILSEKAQHGEITINDLQGGTFTISNGGIYGSMLSTPILNPPQTGILGMHNIVKRAVVKDGDIIIRPIMYLALSYDHRIIDGKEAVSFLKTVKECLEEPRRLFLDL